MKQKTTERKRRRVLILVAVLLLVALWILLPVLKKPSGPVNDENVPISYETLYSEYVRETLLPQMGKAQAGDYEYNRYGDTGEIQKARDNSGIISAMVEDIDGNSVPEMLVVSLVPGEENFDYSQVEVDLYGYDKKTGKVERIRRLTDPFTYSKGEETTKVRPLTVSGMEDTVNVFFEGDYLCMESMAVGEKASQTITLFETKKIEKDPGVMLRAEQTEGRPLTYTLYRPENEPEDLFEKTGKESEYLEEFLAGNEKPVSEEALAWLTSSIGGAEEWLGEMGFTPQWREEEAFLWVDGRKGIFSVFHENVRLVSSYANRLTEEAQGPSQPAVQTVLDGTAFQKTYDF